ncbi:MAG: omega-6 fatty acid desaturase (delta-12 desaturase) [Pirellulaceae bacterium]
MIVKLQEAGKARKTLLDYDAQLSGYRQPSAWRSVWQLSSTLVLFVSGWIAMYLSLSVSYWLTLLISVPTALFVVRLFIFQHDCGHRSFFKSKRTNDILGAMLSVITFTPYHAWRREHAAHHATSGDLDRRGKSGEIWTLTIEEYYESSWLRRLGYRLYRNPVLLFGLGPFYHFVIHQRLVFIWPKARKLERRSIFLTNLSLLAFAGVLSWIMGPLNFLAVQLPVISIAAVVGVWMFYVQHQFEEAFWESSENWDYVQAALDGSSHFRLPKLLRWCTGNIGLHHIHHLDGRIPNYYLQACHDSNPEFQEVVEFSIMESFACMHVRLWNDELQKMVSFSEAASFIRQRAANLPSESIPTLPTSSSAVA